MIQKRGNKWAVIHCHGKNKGKAIGTHATKKKALAQHRAIEISKHKKSTKHSHMGK